jgi:RND family efflux transporter MFP subunit
VDVEALRIDRTPAARTRRGGGRRRSLWPWILLALLLGAGFLFRAPLLHLIDRARLPPVRVVQVTQSHPAAVGAVRGAASNGYIVAARRAALSADTPGRIVELNVTEGSVVKKGDVVARLYADEYRALLQRAQAELTSAQANVERAGAAVNLALARVEQRQRMRTAADAAVREANANAQLATTRLSRAQDLATTGVRAQDAVDEAIALRDQAAAQVNAAQARLEAAIVDVTDAERQVDVARAEHQVAQAQASIAAASVEQAQATLDKTEVRAPFDGVVVLKDAEVGEVVSPNVQSGSNARGAVCTMVDFASLEVQAEVPETTLAAVSIGGNAEVFLDAFPDRRYRGRVDRIWPTANRQKATVEVRVKLLEPDAVLRPEMGVRVVFAPADAAEEAPAASKPQILLPETAVVEIGGKTGAFVLERDVARFVVIDAGERKNARVEIRSGLRPGQRVVLDPPSTLQDGDRVRLPAGS